MEAYQLGTALQQPREAVQRRLQVAGGGVRRAKLRVERSHPLAIFRPSLARGPCLLHGTLFRYMHLPSKARPRRTH
jgi:hypothetical protein